MCLVQLLTWRKDDDSAWYLHWHYVPSLDNWHYVLSLDNWHYVLSLDNWHYVPSLNNWHYVPSLDNWHYVPSLDNQSWLVSWTPESTSAGTINYVNYVVTQFCLIWMNLSEAPYPSGSVCLSDGLHSVFTTIFGLVNLGTSEPYTRQIWCLDICKNARGSSETLILSLYIFILDGTYC